MANVRAFALTGDPLFVGRYRDLLAEERRLFNDLQRVTVSLGPEVIAAYDTLSAVADEWHERATEEEMLAGVLDPAVYTERIPSEQTLWERLLTASNVLRDALHEEETRVRAEILTWERARMVTTAALLVLALLAAMSAAWMGIQIQRLRLEAERRGRELGRLIESRAYLIRRARPSPSGFRWHHRPNAGERRPRPPVSGRCNRKSKPPRLRACRRVAHLSRP
jgi:hypothetical protein